MSLVQKVRNALSVHPGVTTAAAMFGIGLAVTTVVGLVIGIFDHGPVAFANNGNGGGSGHHT